ncbi:hypothetical protein PFLUV_G00177030 [Perca fluviatilis]|uniref:Uncharacterized protein n=1 Tax=Perca fluviatilis TaxID=8168 RepID=A0A6A5EYF1_PERFL|nr:hypothetical protein PFLUV_G00177030 [Perca fluviatilis]
MHQTTNYHWSKTGLLHHNQAHLYLPESFGFMACVQINMSERCGREEPWLTMHLRESDLTPVLVMQLALRREKISIHNQSDEYGCYCDGQKHMR